MQTWLLGVVSALHCCFLCRFYLRVNLWSWREKASFLESIFVLGWTFWSRINNLLTRSHPTRYILGNQASLSNYIYIPWTETTVRMDVYTSQAPCKSEYVYNFLAFDTHHQIEFGFIHGNSRMLTDPRENDVYTSWVRAKKWLTKPNHVALSSFGNSLYSIYLTCLPAPTHFREKHLS